MSGRHPEQRRLVFSAKFVRAVTPLLIFTSLSALAAPQAGDIVSLDGDLNGRTSANFAPGQNNLKFVLKRGTVGKVEQVRHFKSGNYGLLVHVANGDHHDELAWVYYNPQARYIDLCSNDVTEGPDTRECVKAREVAGAKSAEVKRDIAAEAVSPRAPYAKPDQAKTQAEAMLDSTGMAGALRNEDPLNLTPTLQFLTTGMSPLEPKADPCKSTVAGEIGRAPEAGPVARCVRTASAVSKPNFGNSPGPRTRAAFLEFIAPIAVSIQKDTGYPASVLIAQAEIETSWGTSWGYQTRNNLFGQSCTAREFGTWRSYTVTLGGKSFMVKGHCNVPRPSGEGGYYLSFASPRDSIYAYVSDVVQGRSHYYSGISRTLSRANASDQDKTDTALVHYKQIVPSLGAFATDKRYRAKILSEIARYKLNTYDELAPCSK